MPRRSASIIHAVERHKQLKQAHTQHMAVGSRGKYKSGKQLVNAAYIGTVTYIEYKSATSGSHLTERLEAERDTKLQFLCKS